MLRKEEMPGQVFWKPFTISSKRSKRPPGSAVEAVPLWQKVLLHPTLGRLTLRYASLAIESGSGLTLSIYTPADDATRQALGAAPLQP